MGVVSHLGYGDAKHPGIDRHWAITGDCHPQPQPRSTAGPFHHTPARANPSSHSELLFRDLQHLGASRQSILNTSVTAETGQELLASLEALRNCLGQPFSDLALIGFLRF